MDDPSKKGRPIRPGFAEDVYGPARTNPTSTGSAAQMKEPPEPPQPTTEMCGSALAQRRSANLPKLKELCAGGGSSELNISSMECPLASARAIQMGELEFQYADSDNHRNELAELYTYSEMDEFALNYDCFVKYMRERKKEPLWSEISHREKCTILQNIVSNFDNIEAELRLESARIILYLLQGAYGDFAELESKAKIAESDENGKEEEDGEENDGGNGLDIPEKWFGPDHGTGGYEPDCLMNAAANAYFLYEQGLFQSLCSLMRLETSLPFERYADHSRQSSVSNSRSASHMDLATSAADVSGSTCGTLERRRSKRSATLADNERIRVVLNCIYHMVESMRREELVGRVLVVLNRQQPSHGVTKYTMERVNSLRKQFLVELEEPLEESKTPLVIHLLEMMPSFVRAKNPHYPIKKILLLCWKVLLATLGGIDVLRKEKAQKRMENGLPPIEDTLEAGIKMKPIANCGLGPTGFFGLGLGGAGIGGANVGGHQVQENESGNIRGELGRKVRSIHTVRPFNRQVACSGQSGQDTPTVSQRERSNAFSDDLDGKEEPGIVEMGSERAKDFEDVNDAIMPMEEEEEEGGESEQLADENESSTSDLLDQVLEELSSNVTDEEEELERGKEGTAGQGDEEYGGSKLVLSEAPTNPKITVSTGENDPPERERANLEQEAFRQCSDSDYNIQYKTKYFDVDKYLRAMEQEVRRWSRDNEDANELRRKLIAVQIDRKINIKESKKETAGPSAAGNGNGDGAGDQTPKACQSPIKNSPWPPPPPPGLPWKSKVRESDIEQFLQNERIKFFDYILPNDSTTLFGLPEPVHGSVAAMRRNIYTSLNELQLKAEERYNKYPFSQRETIEHNATERLYCRVLPSMTEYVIALLKVILASLPSSKAKIDAVTILSDVLTPETDTNEMLSNSISLDLSHLSNNVLEEHVRVAIDINRHKELIIKAASSIIILLLKHFRLNHVYQFENFAQYLFLANCLPLVLKFLDQNICRYFQSKFELMPFNYPQSALYIVRNGNEWPQLNADNVDAGESPTYFLWRNVFSTVNLLRIINKLTKAKQGRIMMLVVYKSAPVLKRCMRAKLGIFQLYVLKLLKAQARYLGRQWRKTNMDLISAIYMRVRHRLNDDWAFANETTRTKSHDYQREENELGMAIKRFNGRRYSHLMGQKEGTGDNSQSEHEESSGTGRGKSTGGGESGGSILPQSMDALAQEWDLKEWEPLDNSLQSALAWQPQFSERFMRNYRQWLDEEVFGRPTDWDALLQHSRGLLDLYC